MTDRDIRGALQDMATSLQPTSAARTVVMRAVAKRRLTRSAGGATALTVAALGTVVAISMAGTNANGPVAQRVQPASAAQPTGADQATEIAWQISIRPYVDQLMREAAAHTNYTSAEVRFASKAVIIYGTGAPADDVAELLAASPSGTEARWVSVPYSRGELDQASQRLATELPDVVGVNYRGTDYASLVVGVDPLPSTQAELEELHRKAAAITDIPVVFEDSRPAAIGSPTSGD